MEIIPEIMKEDIISLISNNKRLDGRSFYEFRDIKIKTGVISKAEGSARVKLGDTQVLVGVKPTIGEPFPDNPNLGIIITNSELLPMASPTFEPGPPDERSIELARVVDRCIRESNMLDLEKLCIIEGEKVWILFIDLHILDYDGNLFDASVLGAVAALMDTKLPKVSIEDDEVVIDDSSVELLDIKDKVAMCTFAKIGDELVLDPSLEEEEILTARLSIGMNSEGKICAMQKGGKGSLSREDISKAINIAEEKTPELLQHLENIR